MGGFKGEIADNIYYARFQNGGMRVCRGFGRFARFHSVIWALCPRLEDGPGVGARVPGARGVVVLPGWCLGGLRREDPAGGRGRG